ncbi:hypothetical protein ACQP0U_08180 [Micromonospora sp. CA-269861]|uniref:hypothetical protein n=1 Tax=Micromonospora sp. CA-269861 TaxID=3239968 RepID=UPI003D8C16C7
MSRPTMPDAAPSRPPWRQTGSALLAVGVLLLVVAFWLPAWRSVYLDRTDTTAGSKVLGWALPVLACGSITGTYWYFKAEDPYVEHELISTGPGVGLLLALLACLLIPLAGSLPDGQKRTDRRDHDRPDQTQ